jgi:hypothetical protein
VHVGVQNHHLLEVTAGRQVVLTTHTQGHRQTNRHEWTHTNRGTRSILTECTFMYSASVC